MPLSDAEGGRVSSKGVSLDSSDPEEEEGISIEVASSNGVTHAHVPDVMIGSVIVHVSILSHVSTHV